MGPVDHLNCVHGRYLGSFSCLFQRRVLFPSSILLKAAYGLFGGILFVFLRGWM